MTHTPSTHSDFVIEREFAAARRGLVSFREKTGKLRTRRLI